MECVQVWAPLPDGVAQRKRAELEVSKIKRLRGGGGDRSREKETNKQLGQTQIATFNYIIYF